jgi:hypothetical protein
LNEESTITTDQPERIPLNEEPLIEPFKRPEQRTVDRNPSNEESTITTDRTEQIRLNKEPSIEPIGHILQTKISQQPPIEQNKSL